MPGELPAYFVPTARKVVTLFADTQYEEIEATSSGVRLTATELRTAVENCGRTVSATVLIDQVTAVKVDGRDDRRSVVVPLCTIEEALSDLTLSLPLTARDQDCITIEIDDLHVAVSVSRVGSR